MCAVSCRLCAHTALCHHTRGCTTVPSLCRSIWMRDCASHVCPCVNACGCTFQAAHVGMACCCHCSRCRHPHAPPAGLVKQVPCMYVQPIHTSTLVSSLVHECPRHVHKRVVSSTLFYQQCVFFKVGSSVWHAYSLCGLGGVFSCGRTGMLPSG